MIGNRIGYIYPIFLIMSCLVVSITPCCRAGLEIHCIDVGQGDCTLIISPTGKTFLFDAGWNDMGDEVVVPYLQDLGFTSLDYICASHYHADHIGGVDEIIDAYSIDSINVAVLDRGWSYTTVTYGDYADAAGPKRVTISDGQVIDLGGGATVTCVAVNGNGELSPPFDDEYEENELCVALLVEYADFDFFVAGDLSGVNSSYYNDIESSVAPEVGDVDIYRVDHHGSASNSNATLVSTLLPEVSIISVGSNSYGHPTQTVINRLITYGSYIYQTGLGSGGTIPPGEGKVVGGHIVISVEATYYDVTGDTYTLECAGVEVVREPGRFLVCPNPFYRETTVSFDIPAGECFRFEIYDVRGRLVNVHSGWGTDHGENSFTWYGNLPDGRNVSPGVYFVRVSSPSLAGVSKVVRR